MMFLLWGKKKGKHQSNFPRLEIWKETLRIQNRLLVIPGPPLTPKYGDTGQTLEKRSPFGCEESTSMPVCSMRQRHTQRSRQQNLFHGTGRRHWTPTTGLSIIKLSMKKWPTMPRMALGEWSNDHRFQREQRFWEPNGSMMIKKAQMEKLLDSRLVWRPWAIFNEKELIISTHSHLLCGRKHSGSFCNYGIALHRISWNTGTSKQHLLMHH